MDKINDPVENVYKSTLIHAIEKSYPQVDKLFKIIIFLINSILQIKFWLIHISTENNKEKQRKDFKKFFFF